MTQNSNLNLNDLKFQLNFEKFNNSCLNLGYFTFKLILINYFSHEFRSRKFCFPSTERNFFLCLKKKNQILLGKNIILSNPENLDEEEVSESV